MKKRVGVQIDAQMIYDWIDEQKTDVQTDAQMIYEWI